MGKLRPPYIGWSAPQGVSEISSRYHSVQQKMQTNLFQQEESLLALKTKHLGVVLVSGMARFWTQSKAQFPWCAGAILGWVCFLLRLSVASGLWHLQPLPPGSTQQKRARSIQVKS